MSSSLSRDETIDQMFEKVLADRGVYPRFKDNRGFPFASYDEFLAATKAGLADLSFGLPSGNAFKIVASEGQKRVSAISMATHFTMAPLGLIATCLYIENYTLLIALLAWFPASAFANYPASKRVGGFLIICVVAGLVGWWLDWTSVVVVSIFAAVVSYSASKSRNIYNEALLTSALRSEKELMFLLGAGYFLLTDSRGGVLWRPER